MEDRTFCKKTFAFTFALDFLIRYKVSYVVILLSALAYIFINPEQVHVYIVKAFAYIGQQDAQHILGQRYYVGRGVERNKTLAFYWFHQAADQGHVHASYNLAVGHIQGFHRRLKKGEAHKLIKNAAEKGVTEAIHVLENVCKKGHCDF